MKKIIALLLVLFSITSLCACSDLMDSLSHLGDIVDDMENDGDSKTDEVVPGEFINLSYRVNSDRTTCTVTGCGGTDGEDFEIPSEIDGYTVTGIGDEAFVSERGIKSLTVPEGVVRIGARAFRSAGITEMILPESLKYIGEDAFKNTVYFNNEENWSDGVLYAGAFLLAAEEDLNGTYVVKSGTVVIADSAFADCDLLTRIEMPVSMRVIGAEAFEDCELLSCIEMPGTVEYIGARAFKDCIALLKIELPANLKYAGACILIGCESLYDIKISSSDYEMSLWDESWDRGEDIDPDSHDPAKPSFSEDEGENNVGGGSSNTDDKDDSFDGGADMPDDEQNGTENPDGDKDDTQKPDDNVSDELTNGDDALTEKLFTLVETTYFPEFANSDNCIEGYRISGFNIGYAMYKEHLKELHIPSSYRGKPIISIGSGKDPKYEKDFRNRGFYENSLIEKVYIPSSVKIICAYAFMGCENLNEIIFDDSCQTELCFRAFADCSSLKSGTVRIPSGVIADRNAQVFYESWVKSFSFGINVTQETVSGVCMHYEEHIYFDGTAEDCLSALQNYCALSADHGNNGTVHCTDGDYTFREIWFYDIEL